jgi:hypothetical protein
MTSSAYLANMQRAAMAGMIAARHCPADPAVWFDAAMAAGFSQQIFAWPGGLQFNLVPTPDAERPADPEAESFLFSWLGNTPGGTMALWSFMRARGVNVSR